ncbi:MAG: efflux RND transporter periplasmic adaptor subunit [Legionellales bacterium]|nr:efflux RND transporter periplasmic adaptor subunit [Legionellales bacterium]
MIIHTWIVTLRARYEKLPEEQKPIALILGILLGALCLFVVFKGLISLASLRKSTPPIPNSIHQENKIIIPEGSHLRSKLKINIVKSSNKPHIASFPGIVETDPAHIVNILPPLTGRLTELKVHLGDHVEQDQVLATISSPDLATATADHDKALSLLKLTTEALNRAQRVNRVGANSLKDIEIARSNYTQALAEVGRTTAKLQTLGKNSFAILTLKAPTKGRITAINYGTGSYVNDLTMPLMTISNISTIWVTANIPENLAGIVSANLPVDVVLPAYPKMILHGKISFVSSFIEPDTRSNKTRIVFSNPLGKLQPNMYATVNIAIPEPNQIMIPISALFMNNDTSSVFVETTPWTFVRQNVVLGMEDVGNIRILKGLKTGDRVVTSGGVLMND